MSLVIHGGARAAPEHFCRPARQGILAAMGRLAPLIVLAPVTMVMLVAGCARTLPPERTQAVLYRDLERLVTLRSAAGWQIDRVEVEGLLPDALLSVCRSEPAVRAGLLAWLDHRLVLLGGPVESAYHARGRDLDAVAELLEVTRIRMTLYAAMDAAGRDCPFWVVPEAGFPGRQISDDRWQLSAGGGGKGVFLSRNSAHDVQFGGSGRVLLGRNLGARWAAYTGLEVSGSAGFPKNPGGDRASLVLTLDVLAPAVVRTTLVNTYLELEAGYLAHLSEDDWGHVDHGFHVGAGIGARAARLRRFFPGAVFAVSYERVAEDTGPLHLIKMGFRVAVDMDF